jgi:hypothetical protein
VIVWRPKDLASGAYLVRAVVDGKTFLKRVVIVH